MDVVRVLCEKEYQAPREFPWGLPDERWEFLRGLEDNVKCEVQRRPFTTLSVRSPCGGWDSEVLAEFQDLLEVRFSPEIALGLALRVIHGVNMNVAAKEAGVCRRRLERELKRLQEMYR